MSLTRASSSPTSTVGVVSISPPWCALGRSRIVVFSGVRHRRSALSRLDLVGVGAHPLAELLIGALHLRMVAVDVLAGRVEQGFLVRGLEVVAAGTLNCKHGVPPLPVALTEDGRAPVAML